jgi:hypothetical protein
LRKFDAALVVACFVLAFAASAAFATEKHFFLSQNEPPNGGNNNGIEAVNGHVWGWAGGGGACIHEYIETAGVWTSPNCSVEYEEGVNNYADVETKPGAWNDANEWYGEHYTEGEQWYP